MPSAQLRKDAIEVMDRDSWLALHYDRDHISASQAAAALGYDPWCSPLKLYALRRGEADRPDESLPMRLGKLLEPITAQLYEESTGRATVDLGEHAVIRHPQCPWLFSTLDRLSVRTLGAFDLAASGDARAVVGNVEGCVELKSTNSYSKREWTDAEGPGPLQYQLQNQVQLMCSDLMWGSLAALVGNHDFIVHDFERQGADFEENVLKGLDAFRMRVQRGDEPPAQIGDKDTLFQMHPADNGLTLVGEGDDVELVQEWMNTKGSLKTLEEHEELLKTRIIQRIGDHTFFSVDGRTLSYKTQERRTKATVEGADVHLLDQFGVPYTPGKVSTLRVLRESKGK